MNDDTINRQAAIDYFVTNVGFHDEDGYPIDDSDELRKIWTEYFDGIPSAVRRGRWMQEEYIDGEWYHTCSSCGMSLKKDAFDNFCGNCGAKMDKENRE